MYLMGKKATTFFSDRESSIVSIADSAHWSRYSNGVFSGDLNLLRVFKKLMCRQMGMFIIKGEKIKYVL